jgi:hypothetical protein
MHEGTGTARRGDTSPKAGWCYAPQRCCSHSGSLTIEGWRQGRGLGDQGTLSSLLPHCLRPTTVPGVLWRPQHVRLWPTACFKSTRS